MFRRRTQSLGALLLFCAITLLGCSPANQWIDTTGQARSEEQARADERTCQSELGSLPPAIEHLSYEQRSTLIQQRNAYHKSFVACMAARGWKAKRWWRWLDTTGQGRSEDQADEDLEVCDRDSRTYDADLTCMAAKGWKSVRATSKD
jgi:hypothetical protein